MPILKRYTGDFHKSRTHSLLRSLQLPNTVAFHRRPTMRLFEAKGWFPARRNGFQQPPEISIAFCTAEYRESTFNVWTN